MPRTKIDYQQEVQVYSKLRTKGEKISQVKYCEARSKELGSEISVPYFRKVLAKLKKKPPKKTASKPQTTLKDMQYDFDVLKAEFVAGPYKSVSDFCRQRKIKPSGYFRTKTKGWTAEKKKIQSHTELKTVENMIADNAAEATRDLYSTVLSIQFQLFELLKMVAQSHTRWKEVKSPYTAREAANFVIDMERAIERIVPAIRGLEKMSEVNKIFDRLADGTMDVTKASFKLLMLGVKVPKALELMLAKHQIEEPELDDNDVISDEAILAKREQLLKAVEKERIELVAERTKYVSDLKKKMKGKDSFVAQAKVEGGE